MTKWSFVKKKKTAPPIVEVDGEPAAVIELVSGFSLIHEKANQKEPLGLGLRYPVVIPSNSYILAPRDPNATRHAIWEYFVRVREKKKDGSLGPYKAICLLCRASVDGSSVEG